MAIPSEVEAVEYAPINNVQGFPRTGATFVPKRLRKKKSGDHTQFLECRDCAAFGA
jgi:hypothetical protein